MPQNDSVDKTSKNYLADKGKSSANAARPDPENEEKPQTAAALSAPIATTKDENQETKSQASQPQTAAANQGPSVSAGSPAKEQNKNPQSPRAEAKERNQEKPSPTKGSKGTEQKTHEGSQDAPVLPKKADKEADKTTPQSEEAPPNLNTGAEPAAPTSTRKAKAAAAAPLVSKGKTQPAAKGDAKKRQRK